MDLVRHAWAFPTLQNNKAPVSMGMVEVFCLFVACSCWSKEATALSCCFSWVWSSMPKVLWNISGKGWKVEWFCRFFGCSYLHLVRYLLKLQKYAIFGLALSGIGSQTIRLSDVLNLKNLKIIWERSWFFASIEATKICYFGLWLQNTLGQTVCWISYFWLVWLVNLNTGGHCYIVIVYFWSGLQEALNLRSCFLSTLFFYDCNTSNYFF